MLDFFYDYIIRNPEDLLRKVQTIEKYIRHSKEYRKYLQYIKEELKIRNCDYFTDYDAIDNDVDLELHHIITLYDLCVIAGRKLLDEHPEGIMMYDVVKEVILMHFNDYVPVIMLTTTIHQMYHNGLYQLKQDSNSLNLGNYKEFYTKYKEYLLEDHLVIYKYFGVGDLNG